MAVVVGLGFGAPPAGQPRDAAPFLRFALRIRWSASLVDRAAQMGIPDPNLAHLRGSVHDFQPIICAR